MAKQKAIRNVSNRTLEFIFDENNVERICPRETGNFHSEDEISGSFAEQQIETFLKNDEIKIIEKEDYVDPHTQTEPKKKGDKQ